MSGFTEYLRDRQAADEQHSRKRLYVDPRWLFIAIAIAYFSICGSGRDGAAFLSQAAPKSSAVKRTAGFVLQHDSRPKGNLTAQHLASSTVSPAAGRTVWVTTYSMKYEGRRTKTGVAYRAELLTCAVPRSEWKALHGKRLLFSLGGKSVTCLVNDTCGPNVRNFDLSTRAWAELTGGKPGSRIKARMGVAQ